MQNFSRRIDLVNEFSLLEYIIDDHPMTFLVKIIWLTQKNGKLTSFRTEGPSTKQNGDMVREMRVLGSFFFFIYPCTIEITINS